MSFSFELNRYLAGNAAFFFRLRQLLIAKGWTVPQDSDGTTYSSSGTQITNANLNVANSIWNPLAWYRLVHPTSKIEYIIQKGNTNPTTGEYWRIYTSVAGFTGGAPNATTPPTATDQLQIAGTSGADRSYGIEDGDFVADFILGDSYEDYSFYVHQRCNGLPDNLIQRCPIIKASLGFEKLLQPASDDTWPYVSICSTTGGSSSSFDLYDSNSTIFRPDTTLGTQRGAVGRYRHGLTGAQWVKWGLAYPAQQGSAAVSNLNDDPGAGSGAYGGLPYFWPLFYVRGSVATQVATGAQTWPANGYKGLSRLFRYAHRQIQGAILLDQKYFAQFSSVVIPWDGQSEIK